MHEKHSKLEKPQIGNFGRTEVAFVGTTCGNILNITTQIIDALHLKYNITYIDAEHGKNDDATLKHSVLTYKNDFQCSEFQSNNSIDKRSLLNAQDLIITNGNHFEASQQIVFIDRKKEASLFKRVSQLSQIKAFILVDDAKEIFDFLKIDDWQNIPTFQESDIVGITTLIKSLIQKPPLKGLVLAGGKSTRMGIDKSLIAYHNKPQRAHAFDLLAENCLETFISCRPEQTEMGFPIIKDSFLDLGPLGAILSAFRHDPNATWLVLACDMPLVDKQALELLIKQRNPAKFATAYFNPTNNLVEPLFCIWEPKAYQILLNYLALGYACPRKILKNIAVEILYAADAEVFANANTPADSEWIKNKIVEKSV